VLARIVKLARASLAAAAGKEIAGVASGRPARSIRRPVLCCSPQPGVDELPLRDRRRGTESARHARQRRQLRDFGEWWRGAARGSD